MYEISTQQTLKVHDIEFRNSKVFSNAHQM